MRFASEIYVRIGTENTETGAVACRQPNAVSGLQSECRRNANFKTGEIIDLDHPLGLSLDRERFSCIGCLCGDHRFQA